ncbi:MAG: hypothetical protein JWP61_477 [Friedmanniella sp.]|jgi:hypothetical protein|nr:hypothetical protein [Friedmanniella sp.]
MTALLVTLWLLVPLDATLAPGAPGSPVPVYPEQGSGFAAYIVGGFFALGLLVLAMMLISLKPRRASPQDPRAKARPSYSRYR